MKYLALFINIFTDPIVSFQELKKINDWKTSFMPLIVLMLLGAVSLLLLKELYYDVQLEQSVKWIENSSQIPDDQKEDALKSVYESLENPRPFSILIMWLTNVFAGPLRIIMTTLIVLMIVKFFFGESTRYSNLLPYVSFSYLITVLETVIKIPLMINKWSIDVYTGLGLLDISEKGTFINNLFAAMDLFSVWRIILIGIGLSVYYKKSAKPFIIAIFVYWLFQISIFAALGSLFI
ncbi:uncharacterized protein METZ01_LOCUS7833 [marine metagenome]|uniref:Yip1 domain-containing protein n=1 Tax=marine metagenome TaxID=408172 RepID=A0A381NKU9_9ZZZZ